MKLNNLTIPNNIFLAPMAGVTDMPYRKLCKEMGAGLVYTEMVSSKAIQYGSEKTEGISKVFDEERPVAVQIFGSEPDIMAETAKKISEYADIIDINMGCPVNKIVKNNEGSALMKNIKLAEEIITKVVEAVEIPVTVKFRKGYDHNNINAVEFAQMAESSGAKLITIHGRTREDMYSGKADLDIIKQVKNAVKIPVIGNGDIITPQTAKNMFDYTGVDGIMIARGSVGNPWIFRNIIEYLENGNLIEEPTVSERMDMAIRHLEETIKYKGEYTGIREMRKNLFLYIKGLPNATDLRNKISMLENKEDVIELLLSLK
ncbi:MAG: tRNA dihydrouridine synthase DusB [Clostridiales bacterium]|nr:tRNA dihydrouridine synthase DusB [Clostridiales bacterium]